MPNKLLSYVPLYLSFVALTVLSFSCNRKNVAEGPGKSTFQKVESKDENPESDIRDCSSPWEESDSTAPLSVADDFYHLMNCSIGEKFVTPLAEYSIYVNDKLINEWGDSYGVTPACRANQKFAIFNETRYGDRKEIVEYNAKARAANEENRKNLEAAFAASSCTFKVGDIAKLYPENTMSESETAAGKDPLELFQERFACLGQITLRPVEKPPLLAEHDALLTKLNSCHFDED